MDRVVLAGFLAYSAADAADIADLAKRSALLVRGAGDVHIGVIWNRVDYLFRTCIDAGKASRAALMVDKGDAVDKADGPERAGIDATAKADAAVCALGRPACNEHCGVAIAYAYVLVLLSRVVAAGTVYECGEAQVLFDLDPEYFRDLFGAGISADDATGDIGGAFHKGLGKCRATGISAAPAIRAGKHVTDRLEQWVLFYLKELGSYGKYKAKYRSEQA
jgi:hypothetical protein